MELILSLPEFTNLQVDFERAIIIKCDDNKNKRTRGSKTIH